MFGVVGRCNVFVNGLLWWYYVCKAMFEVVGRCNVFANVFWCVALNVAGTACILAKWHEQQMVLLEVCPCVAPVQSMFESEFANISR